MSASNRINKSYRVNFITLWIFYEIDIYRLKVTWPEKSAYNEDATTSFPRMTSAKRAQKFHTDDVSLPRSG